MGKIIYKKISKNDFFSAFMISKDLCHSLENPTTIIRQFNKLTPVERSEIINEFNLKDMKLRTAITNGDESLYLDCTFVNIHIIATIYDIDPLTVVLCILKLCKNNEKLLIK